MCVLFFHFSNDYLLTVGQRATSRPQLRFDLLKDEKDPTKFYFYEVYKNNKEAIDYHKSMEHYKAWASFKDSGGVEEQYASKAIAIDYTPP